MSTVKATALLLERLGSASALVLSQHYALPAEPVTGAGHRSTEGVACDPGPGERQRAPRIVRVNTSSARPARCCRSRLVRRSRLALA
jgi:hypothetical protein